MRRKLLKGFWLVNVPLGYDQYGPRIKREQFFCKEQKVVINKYGELLREAWIWKASGIYNDAQILSKLSARGLKLTPQKISTIWKNHFTAES